MSAVPSALTLLMASIIADHGTEDQKQRILPEMASGEIRGGLGLTEPEAGSDVQGIRTTATRDGEEYVLNGRKMFITNAENGNAYAVLAKTNPDAEPAYRGMSCFIVRKPNHGLSVGQHIDKLGYRGVDTGELIFDDCRVGEEDLIGGTRRSRFPSGDERSGIGPHQCGGTRSGRRNRRV